MEKLHSCLAWGLRVYRDLWEAEMVLCRGAISCPARHSAHSKLLSLSGLVPFTQTLASLSKMTFPFFLMNVSVSEVALGTYTEFLIL
jgi:hypothetical protein